MDFVAVVDQVFTLLRQRGRLTYGTLKRQFELDDAALEDLKEELIYGQRLAVDEDERVLVWVGDTAASMPPVSGHSTALDASQLRAPLAYTPSYLAEKILTSRTALEGERTQVTVLFADLKGSMELLADRDPEEARQFLDPVLERMMAAVHRYEGTVNQVMGDGIMALFGAPLAHEDHAVRACYAALAIAYLTAGDFREPLDVARQVIELLTGDLRYAHFGMLSLPAVNSRSFMALYLAELGDFAEGSGVAEDAVRIAEAVERPFSIATALWYAGLVYRRQGALHTAISMLERGLVLCQTANIPIWHALTASILAAAYALAGRAAEACPLLDQTLERVATGSGVAFHALVLTELSEALLLVSRVDEASTIASRLFELSRTHTGSGYQAHVCRLLGEVAMRREPPDIDQATTHYHQGLALAAEIGMRPLQAHCHRSLGTLYAATDQREQAQATLSTAIALYRDMDMTFWLPQTETALAQVGRNEERSTDHGCEPSKY